MLCCPLRLAKRQEREQKPYDQHFVLNVTSSGQPAWISMLAG